jgi:hypothetical protein
MKKIEFLANLKGTIETANLVTTKYGYALNSWGSYLLDSQFTIKKGDLGTPVITCSIRTHTFHNALCDLGSSVNIMSKAAYDRENSLGAIKKDGVSLVATRKVHAPSMPPVYFYQAI